MHQIKNSAYCAFSVLINIFKARQKDLGSEQLHLSIELFVVSLAVSELNVFSLFVFEMVMK